MNSKKSLAKVFGPVLLLTASLALPLDTFAAPQGRGRAAAEEKADKNERQGKNRQNRAQQRRVEPKKKQEQPQRRQQAVRQQRSQRPQVKQQQVKQQQAVRQNRIEQQRAKERQAALRQERIRQQQASQRQLDLQRQQTVQRQRALEQQRAVERQRLLNQQAYNRQQALERQRALERRQALELQRRNRAYRHDDRNRANTGYYNTAPRQGGGGGADRSIFHIDGYLQGGRDCLIVRDHDGRIWSLVGNTYGLGEGEHVRLYGRIVDGGACGWEGTSFDIYEVRTVWADDRHRSTHYDHLHDGPFNSNADYDRYGNDGYDDRDDDRSWFDKLFGG